MASNSSASTVTSILVLSEKEQPKIALSHGIQVFTNYEGLITNLFNHLKDVDEFRLHIPGAYLNKLLDDKIQDLAQVRSINFYYDTDDAHRASNDRLVVALKGAEKFKFYPTRDFESQLENDENAAMLDLSGSMNISAVRNIIQSKRERLHEKSMKDSDNGPSEAKRFASTAAHPLPLAVMLLRLEMIRAMIKPLNQNNEPVEPHSDNPWSYGARPKPIPVTQVQFDRDYFERYPDLSTQCLQCPWAGKFENYQKHRIRHHREHDNSAVGSAVYNDNSLPSLTSTQMNINDYYFFPSKWIMLDDDHFNQQIKYLDNEYLWMIKSFASKRIENQMAMIDSIDSPEFRSSTIAYPMRLHLSPNGHSNKQDADISLSLGMMNDNDEVLHRRPVHFQMKVTLVNRSRPDRSQTRYFCFSIESNASQRPNTLIGISKYFSFNFIEQNLHNDTLFIEITLNVLAENLDDFLNECDGTQR